RLDIAMENNRRADRFVNSVINNALQNYDPIERLVLGLDREYRPDPIPIDQNVPLFPGLMDILGGEWEDGEDVQFFIVNMIQDENNRLRNQGNGRRLGGDSQNVHDSSVASASGVIMNKIRSPTVNLSIINEVKNYATSIGKSN